MKRRFSDTVCGNERVIARVMTHLLVGEDEKDGVTKLVLIEHAHQLLSRLSHTLAIVRVDHEYQTCKQLLIFK